MVGVLACLGPLVTTVTPEIGKWLADLIKNQCRYLFQYKTNIKKLRDGVEDLENSRAGVQQSVDAAKRNLEVIKPDVLAWLNGVDEIEKEAEEIIQAAAVRVGNKLCCFGARCPNIRARYLFSRKAFLKLKVLVKLQGKCRFTIVSDPPPPVEMGNALSLSCSEGFGSRVSTRVEIMGALKDDAVFVIGICGMGGVGKTTMAKEVGARVKDEHLFDVVVMVDVTQTPNKKIIQGSIAELLGLKLQEDSLLVRAARLSARLKMYSSVLVILDNVWTRLDLEELGIPFGADGQRRGCKILLTSRSINACNQMKADRIFKIREMPLNEAWILFERTTEKSFHPYPDLYQLARDIVEGCGGLPLAIVTIARVLEREKDKSMWDDALQRLRGSNLEGEYAAVYSSVELTYNFLESDEMKRIFLLCCLFPAGHDVSIEDLLRLGLGLSLFKKVDGVNEARTRTNAFIQKLKNLNLLFEGGDEQSIKLHDLVRDSGLKIASKNENVFVVKHGDGLKFWPTEVTDECCSAISLRCDEMSELPSRLRCPKLELLHLVGGSRPLDFPASFYESMVELKALVLKGMLVQSYPVSFEFSSKLQNLSLEYCTFDKTSDLSMIGDLVKLEILSFVHSDVKELPVEIGNLTQLKVLDLTGCGDLYNIAPGLMQRLIHLEELYMRGTLVSWPDEQITACLRELNSLSQLTALEIELSSYDLIPHDFVFSRLNRFRVCVGFSIESKVFRNTLKLRFPAKWADGGIEVLFNRTDILHLQGWRLLMNSTLDRFERQNFLMLKSLKLEYCDLSYLTDLCSGQWSVGEITVDEPDIFQFPLFGNLCDLEVVRCVNLKSIFSISALRGFLKLESLKIIGCEVLEEIFLKRSGDQDEKTVVEIELPNLKCLVLDDLPCLSSFCKDISSLVVPQLLELRLCNLPKINQLTVVEENRSFVSHTSFSQKILLATQLKVLSVSKMKMNEMQKNLLPALCFINLRFMSLSHCDDLTSAFLFDLIQKSHDLKVLHVEECRSVIVVFDIDRLLLEDPVIFNNLTDLELENLPRMTHIWKLGDGPQAFESFQNLTKLSVASCHQLTYLLSSSITNVLFHLQELSITECRRITVIIEQGNKQEASETRCSELVFPRLKSLELIDLPTLKCLCLELLEFKWPSLESVWIDCCKEMTVFTAGNSSTPKLKTISVNGVNRTMEGDINTSLKGFQEELNDGDTSDSTVTSRM